LQSLKAFLYDEAAPVLGMTGGALYEIQRKLVALGVLPSIPGRGRRAGVVLTAESFAAVLIAALAGPWSEIDERVVALLRAPVDFAAAKHRWQRALEFDPDAIQEDWEDTRTAKLARRVTKRYDTGRHPGFLEAVFLEAVALAISDPGSPHKVRVPCGVRVSRLWRGQIVFDVLTSDEVDDYVVRDADGAPVPRPPVSITAEIEGETFTRLGQVVQRALGSE
jgi:hypothetical protein